MLSDELIVTLRARLDEALAREARLQVIADVARDEAVELLMQRDEARRERDEALQEVDRLSRR